MTGFPTLTRNTWRGTTLLHDDVTAGDWIALLRLTIFLFAHLGTTKYLARRKSANPEYTRIMRELGKTSWRKDIKPRKNASSSSAGSTGSISVEFSITRPSTSVRNVPQRSARKTMPIEVVEHTIDIMAGQPTFSVRLRQAWQGALWRYMGSQEEANCLAASFKFLWRMGSKTGYTWPLCNNFFLGCQPPGVDFCVSLEEFAILGMTPTESCFDNGGWKARQAALRMGD